MDNSKWQGLVLVLTVVAAMLTIASAVVTMVH